MREQLCHRARAAVDTLPASGKRSAGQPGGADADRRAVGEPQRIRSGSAVRRSSVQVAARVPCPRLPSDASISCAARLAAARADDLGKARARPQTGRRGAASRHRCRCRARRAPGPRSASAASARRTVWRLTPKVSAISISPGSFSPAAKRPSAMPRSMPSATRRHSATPEAVSCMLMARIVSAKCIRKTSPGCHETVMAFGYQVV